jgi:uncharacterized protein YaiL (DUF2058 family)
VREQLEYLLNAAKQYNERQSNENSAKLNSAIELAEVALQQSNGLSNFPIGTKVRKIKGYKFDGTIVANFRTVAGKDRLVVDNGDGLLHIFNAEQLERAD